MAGRGKNITAIPKNSTRSKHRRQDNGVRTTSVGKEQMEIGAGGVEGASSECQDENR